MAPPRFAILRVEKRHDLGQVGRSQAHNARTGKRPPNVLPGGPEPILLAGSRDVRAELAVRLPPKRRSNAVIAVETLLTASPEWFNTATPAQYEAWKEANIAFCQDTFGGNLMQVYLHEDESSPHLHVYWCPMKDGRLNYRGILGAPSQLVELQDAYAKAMAPFGLQRGVSGSTRRHEKSVSMVQRLDRMENAIGEALKALKTLAKTINTIAGFQPLNRAVDALGAALRPPGPPAVPSRQSERRQRPTGRSGVEGAETGGLKEAAPRVPKRPRP